MFNNGFIIFYVFVLFLWFLFFFCNIGVDLESFLGCCKSNLYSGSIVLVRVEKEWGRRVGKKILFTDKGMLFLIFEGCFKIKDC